MMHLYTYAQVNIDELLETDRTIDPSKITPEALATMPKTSMGYVFSNVLDIPSSTFGKIKKALNILSIWGKFKVHSYWTYIIYHKVMKPLNVPRNKVFTSGKDEMSKIIMDNPSLKEGDFLLPREGVNAMPMILFTMHGSRSDGNEFMKKYNEIKENAWKEYNSKLTLEFASGSTEHRPNMTESILFVRDDHDGNIPIPFVATPDTVVTKYNGTVLIRDKLVDFPIKPEKPHEWGSRSRFSNSRFSIETLTAMSTNFPASSGGLKGLSSRIMAQLLTGMRRIKLTDDFTSTQTFGDGGTSDLTGIIPLVQHGVKNIISVYNFNQNPPYTDFTESYADIYKVSNTTSLTDPDFKVHFQEWLKKMNPRVTCLFGFFGAVPIYHANILNHIFEDPKLNALKELMIKFNSLFKAGEPLIATLNDLPLVDNPFWGVSSVGDNGITTKVDLTLIYFNMPRKFSEQVPRDAVPPPKGVNETIDADGRFNNEQMRCVPELPVDGTDPLHYSHEQVNMVSYLGSWMVNHAWDGLEGHDGETKFEGFGKIFEKKAISAL